MRKLSLIFISLIVAVFQSFSQLKSADELVKKGIVQHSNFQLDSAISLYNQALQIYEKANEIEEYQYTTNLKAASLNQQYKFQEAMDMLLADVDSIKNLNILAYRNSLIGDIKRFERKPLEEILPYYEKSIALLRLDTLPTNKSKIYEGDIYEKIGWLQISNGNPDLAKDVFQLSYKWHQEHDSPLEMSIYGIGVSHFLLGGYDLALQNYERALQLFMSKYGEYHFRVAGLNNDIGGVYREKKEHLKAIESFKKATIIYDKILGENHFNVAANYNNIGISYEDIGQYDSAIYYLQKSLKIHNAINAQAHIYGATIYSNIGDLYRKRKAYKTAMDYFKKSSDEFTKLQAINSVEFSDLQLNLSMLFNEQGKIEQALQACQRGLIANSPNFTNPSINQTPNYDDYINPYLQLQLLIQKIKLLTLKNDHKDVVSQIITSADSLIQTRRISLSSINDKLVVGERGVELHKLAMKIILDRGQLDQHDIDQLYYHSTRQKASTLQEIYSWTNAERFNNIPDSLLNREKELKRKFSELASLKMKSSSEENEKKLYETRQALRVNAEKIRAHFPFYHELNFGSKPKTTEEVSLQLEPNELIIEFSTLENSIAYIAISEKDKTYGQISSPSQIQKTVALLNDAVKNRKDSLGAYAFSVFETLLKPILDNHPTKIDRLIIVPEGFIWNIPFDILLTGEIDHANNNYRQWPYLALQFETVLQYSSSLSSQHTSSNNKEKRILTIAPGTFSGNSDDAYLRSQPMAPLVWSKQEAIELADEYAGISLTEVNASETRLKAEKGFSIVHFATHTIMDNENPMRSRIILSQDELQKEDGALYAFELYNMDIDSDLIVLSSCNSGDGKVTNGEGLLSIAHGFAYAGAPGLIATRWSLDDESAYLLNKNLYKYLAEGKSKSYALKMAKLETLDVLPVEKTHPFYWANYYVVGDNAPVQFSASKSQNWWRAAGLIVLMSIIGIVLYRRKHQK